MRLFLLLAIGAIISGSGCVVRELIVKSEPPGATVYINGREEGKTPLVKQFDFYGARELTLRLEGYRTASKTVTPPVPWFEFFPIDFITEILLPFRIHDRHEYSFSLESLPERPPRDLLDRAGKVRTDGQE